MDFRVQKRTAQLLYSLLTQRNEEAAQIPFTPAKRVWSGDFPESTRLQRDMPEAHGVGSGYLHHFFQEMAEHHAHSVLVLRHGRVIGEKDYAPFTAREWHVTHSLCKSLTALAIGLLVDENKLEITDKVVDFFPEYTPARRQAGITVYQLLTMTSGVTYNEAASITEENWIKGFLESAVRGEGFQYNSMNSYMLAAIACRVSGQSLSDYLRVKLLEPMGIRRFYWECCPEGIEKGGWGLYMLPEDMAKLGQLLLQKGSWEGRQLISRAWVEQATAKQVQTPAESSSCGYGYQIWLGEDQGSFQMSGMLGQNVMVFPMTDMVVVNTAGNMSLEARNDLAVVIEKYFGDGFEPGTEVTTGTEFTVPLGILCRHRRQNCPRRGTDLLQGMHLLYGHSYETQGCGTALLPVFMQAVQNNYSKAINRITFTGKGGTLHMILQCGDEEICLRIGFGQGCHQKIRLRGECYQLAVQGEFTRNEDHILVFKVRICFLEYSNERIIKIYPQPGGIMTIWQEVPGSELILDALEVVSGSAGNLMNHLLSRMDPGFFTYRLQKTMERRVFYQLTEA